MTHLHKEKNITMINTIYIEYINIINIDNIFNINGIFNTNNIDMEGE